MSSTTMKYVPQNRWKLYCRAGICPIQMYYKPHRTPIHCANGDQYFIACPVCLTIYSILSTTETWKGWIYDENGFEKSQVTHSYFPKISDFGMEKLDDFPVLKIQEK